MDSSNHGTNTILPLETIENGNSKIGNQVEFVRQITNTTDYKTDLVHYISWIFGILFTCTALSLTLIVPWHNVLKEPFYVYEIHVYFMIPWLAITAAIYIFRCRYWADITYVNNWTSFFVMFGIGGVIYAALFLSYFYIWVYYFELFAPLPLGPIALAQLIIFVLMFTLYFRYHHS